LLKTAELLGFRAPLNLYSELTDSLPELYHSSVTAAVFEEQKWERERE